LFLSYSITMTIINIPRYICKMVVGFQQNYIFLKLKRPIKSIRFKHDTLKAETIINRKIFSTNASLNS